MQTTQRDLHTNRHEIEK